MTNDILSQLREQIAGAMASVRQCNDAYKGFRAFKNNRPGLAFCAEQLFAAVSALLDHAHVIARIAQDIQAADHTITNGGARPEDLFDVALDGHRSQD